MNQLQLERILSVNIVVLPLCGMDITPLFSLLLRRTKPFSAGEEEKSPMQQYIRLIDKFDFVVIVIALFPQYLHLITHSNVGRKKVI